MKYKLRLENLKEIRQALKKYPEESVKEFKEAIGKSLSYIEAMAKLKCPVDRGRLRSSFKQEIVGLRGKLEVGAKYGIFVEKGTRPHTPPFKAIERWARRKGLPAGAVWMSIRMKGTKAHPFFEPAIKESREMISKFFREAFSKIVKKL